MTIQIFKGVQNQELVLKADYDKLAAECALLVNAAEKVYSAGYNHGHINTVDGIAYERGIEEEFLSHALEIQLEHAETPAADAAIAEFKAQGVDEFVSAIPREDIKEFVGLFAASLRAGVKP